MCLRLGLLARDLEPKQATEVGRLREELQSSLDTIRSLTFELTNPLVYSVGLRRGLESLLAALRRDHGLRVRFDCDDDLGGYPRESGIVCYRVVRELLFNTIRHSGADSATLRIQVHGDRLFVEVADEGAGFDPREFDGWAGETRGLGLFHTNERVERLGGRCEIDSAVGRGTRVRIELPFGDRRVAAHPGAA